MKNHLAVAEAFLQELHQTHQNIVAILLTGSVARRQAAPFSDIDLSIIVAENEENQGRRSGSTWREGIYIDVGFRPQSAFAQLEEVLSNPSAATAIAYGKILYDPTGFLAALQAQVQSDYMQPRWLYARGQCVASHIRSRLEILEVAITVRDSVQICTQAGPIAFGIALSPLIQRGIPPSSTRHLVQLAEVAPDVAKDISALEGSANMSRTDLRAAYDIFAQLTALGDTSRWGELPTYMVRKAEWMIHHDLENAAVHTMWNNVGFRIKDCLATPGAAEQTQDLAQAWLQQMGWTGETILNAKLQLAGALFDDVCTAPD